MCVCEREREGGEVGGKRPTWRRATAAGRQFSCLSTEATSASLAVSDSARSATAESRSPGCAAGTFTEYVVPRYSTSARRPAPPAPGASAASIAAAAAAAGAAASASSAEAVRLECASGERQRRGSVSVVTAGVVWTCRAALTPAQSPHPPPSPY